MNGRANQTGQGRPRPKIAPVCAQVAIPDGSPSAAPVMKPDPWQADVLRSSSGRRLLLNCSRQSGKSTTAAALALHQAIYHPGSLVLLVSPSLRQSGELFRKVMAHLRALNHEPGMT